MKQTGEFLSIVHILHACLRHELALKKKKLTGRLLLQFIEILNSSTMYHPEVNLWLYRCVSYGTRLYGNNLFF